MKLRNKKTGEIVDLAKRGLVRSDNDNHIVVFPEGTQKYYTYNSLSELNEEWEDAPTEPLIKDEEIRKTIKTWARVNDAKEVVFDEYWHSFRSGDIVVGFCFDFTDFDWLEDNKTYTIAELCGEEE